MNVPHFLYFQIPPASKSFQEAQSELNQTAADLNQSAGEVVHASRGTSSQLAVASGKFSQDFDEFLDAGIEMAGHTQVAAVFPDVSLPSVLLGFVWGFFVFFLSDDVLSPCVEKGRPGSGNWEPEEHLHGFQQAAAGCQEPVSRPGRRQRQEPAGRRRQVASSRCVLIVALLIFPLKGRQVFCVEFSSVFFVRSFSFHFYLTRLAH